jgi:starch-binding outer membrane protein SusE/F
MKKKSKLLLFSGLLLAFASCDKVADLPLYGAGTAPVLSASKTAIAPVPADSNNVVLNFSWSYPSHSTDSTNIKYTIEIDSAGKNFSAPYTKVVIAALKADYIAKELNNFLLARGYAFNVPVSMLARLTSSYANNNERIASNTVGVQMTPYKVPPKVALPTTGKLYIVGAATQGGWGNPVPVPTQEFARLSETVWGGVFQLNGAQQYLLLPLNGDWGNKFSVALTSQPGLAAGGDFGFNLSDNFPGPATSGLYKIMVDFQTGKFKVTPYTSTLPTNLFIVGAATAGGWNNPVPVPSQQFTRLNASQWEITLPVIAAQEYLVLPVNGDWGNKYAVANKSLAGLSAGGEFGYNLGDNFPGPSVAGNYKILMNFATIENYSTGKFTATKL